jgi:hypothetical protein
LRLSSTLDCLAADDLHAMFAPQRLDRLGDLLQQQNRLSAELTRAVRECELMQASERDGLKSMQSWLRGHGRLSSALPRSWCATGGRRSTCRR